MQIAQPLEHSGVPYSGGRDAGNPILEAQWYIMKGGVQVILPLEHSGI